MIKDREVAMVNGASLALEYKDKHPRNWDEDALAFVMKNLSATPETKLYGIAAANEILKMRKQDKEHTNKQLLQTFVNNIPRFVSKMNEEMGE